MNLEASAVREDRAAPIHETVQPSQFFNHLSPWSQKKVIRVGQDDLSTRLLQILRGQGLHRGLGAYWHEDRGLECPMRGPNLSQPGSAFFGILQNPEVHHRMSMASP